MSNVNSTNPNDGIQVEPSLIVNQFGHNYDVVTEPLAHIGLPVGGPISPPNQKFDAQSLVGSLPIGFHDVAAEVKPDMAIMPELEEIPTTREERRKNRKNLFGFVREDEVEEAKEAIYQSLGFEPPRMSGHYMCVKVYIRPNQLKAFTDDQGNTKHIYLPDAVTANDKFKSCTGLVLSQGPECYTGDRYEEHWFIRNLIRPIFGRWMKPSKKGPWCRVGDWIAFPRHEGTQVIYRGVPVQMIPEWAVLTPVECPTHVTRD